MTAATRLAAVIGSPVAHSLSPAIHNAAFAALGLPWTYLAFEVAPGRVAQAVRGMRALAGFDGMSVTAPHKLAAANEVDGLSPDAMALGVVNTVVRQPDGRLRGESTDGPGLLASLVDSGFDPVGRRCVVIGAGGAARAITRSLARSGAAEVMVVNRTRENAIRTCAFAGAVGRVGEPQDVVNAELVVNATPLGMIGGDDDRLVLDPAHLREGQLVVDLVYDPPLTPFLQAARDRGATAVNGLGMLVHQAALQFSLWTGEDAPLGAMWAAVGRK